MNELKKIVIEFIPHKEQRYDTPGDYFYDDNGVLNILISDLGDEYKNRLVALHEIIEEAITKKRGITEEQIMEFDLMFENERSQGQHAEDDEPGWDKRACYTKEHAFAEAVERLFCNELGINWIDYNEGFRSL